MDFETPEADAAEQARQDDTAVEDEEPTDLAEVSVDADPADLAEQQRVVPQDDPRDSG